MQHYSSEEFIHKSEKFIISIFSDIDGFKVITFKEGVRISPFIYNSSFSSFSDLKTELGINELKFWVKCAKDDILTDRINSWREFI